MEAVDSKPTVMRSPNVNRHIVAMSWQEIREQLQQNLDQPLSNQLCQLYNQLHIPMIIRRKYARWFEDNIWPDVMEEQKACRLYKELMNFMSDDIETLKEDQDHVLEAVEIAHAKMKIKESFGQHPTEFLKAVIHALDDEKKIISGYKVQVKMEEEVEEEVAIHDIFSPQLEDMRREIENLEQLAATANNHLSVAKQKKEDMLEDKDFDYSVVLSQMGGTINQEQLYNMFTEKQNETKRIIEENIVSFNGNRQMVQVTLRKKLEDLQLLHTQILEKVSEFKHQQKLAFVRAAVKPRIEEVEKWCGNLGNVCWKLFQLTNSPEFREVISTSLHSVEEMEQKVAPSIAAEDNAEVEAMIRKLRGMFKKLLEETFIVTTQPPEVLKMVGARNKGTSREFHTSVSILALSYLQIEQISSNVVASFFAETDIGTYKRKKQVSCSLQNNEAQFKATGSRPEACFNELKVKDFSRMKENDDSRVSKQFYRVTFSTKVTLQSEWIFDLETMSLPIIINTGSNQACEALGSLLWYCYNTDDVYHNFQQPFPNDLPLDKVLDMLSCCLRTISPRDLQEDERRFLGEKLTGKSIKKTSPGEGLTVKFSQFCVSKMNINKDKNVEFSFWKWFQAVMNLIEKYLLEPWKDGKIKGFVSKTSVRKKLMTQRHGTFLIRFSESCVNGDHQDVTGGIVVALKYEDTVTFSPPRTEVHLSKNSLADILRSFINQKNGEALLQTLFPHNKDREASFKKYSTIPVEKKNQQYNSGYPGWITLMGLDLSFSKMNMTEHQNAYGGDGGDMDIWTVSSTCQSPGRHTSRGGPVRVKKRRCDDSPGSSTSMQDGGNQMSTAYYQNGFSNSENSNSSGGNIPRFLSTTTSQSTAYNQPSHLVQDVEQFCNNFGMPLASTTQTINSTSMNWSSVPIQMQNGSPEFSEGTPSQSPSSTVSDYDQNNLSPDLRDIQPSLPMSAFNHTQGRGQPDPVNTQGFMDLLQNGPIEEQPWQVPMGLVD
ncbi:signal transducer and activator of transcription 5B-like isoform X2 [Haliotis rubra]|uniref:signal transducer and activator of transcription 5B-like isoform X2 n=1 Tax=Haliotis rubra TaxID=36100 RepID=UPI001EE557B2|nr:signal transducer and activator of transcription 5B-like isoform X2 [Haliotis rubra]